jgi:predicted NUDIX family NTP pyrophosphohydrolase
MPDYTVHPHGVRWAVREAGAESPVKEFGTREAAELAARDLASGGEVTVSEQDPSGLREDPQAGDPTVPPELRVGGVRETERTRSLQTGL